MDTHELMMTAVRAAGLYVLMLVIIRLSGKRTIGNFTAFDLLVALMLGEVVDEIIYGDVTFAQGMVAILTVALLQYVNSWLSYFDHGTDKYLEGLPTVVVRQGEFDRKGMRKERMNEKDVMAELRIKGISDLREVKLATIENDGQVSVLKEDWAEPIQKADLAQEHTDDDESELLTIGPLGAPPASKRTDSSHALGAS